MVRVLLSALAFVALAPPGAGDAAQAVEHVVIDAGPDTIVRVEGLYPEVEDVCPARRPSPLRARYRGRIQLSLRSEGIRITDHLRFGEYLKGLDEVPRSWPDEALRAQVIAGRSYALDAIRRGASSADRRGYDICATVACQVYRGAAVEQGAFGERWIAAVDGTEGRALTYRDRVIQAFYFSTSSGHTRSSFPGGTPQPWLPSVDGEDDDSPLARWAVRVRLDDLEAMLRERDLWGPRAIERVTRDGDEVHISGGTARRTLTRSGLRGVVNSEGPCLFAGRYPTQNPKTGRRYPQTVPSFRYRLEQEGRVIVFRGRGWGHDVGMSQYGARSLAERGRNAAEILGHFYGPATLSSIGEPATIRVLVADGLRRVRIAIEGPARVMAGGAEIDPGTRFEVRERRNSLEVRAGKGPSLPATLGVTPGAYGASGVGGGNVRLAFDLSRAARVTVILTGAKGEEVARSHERSFEIGEQSTTLRLAGTDGTPLGAGRYSARLEAYDGYDRVRSQAVGIDVAAPASPSPSPTALAARPTAGRGVVLPAIAGVLGGLAAAGVALTRHRARQHASRT